MMTELQPRSLFLLAVIAMGANAIHYPPGKWQGDSPAKLETGKAVYFITNEAVNAVVALPIGSDGMLSGGTTTKTEGKGCSALEATTKQPAVSDVLFSQSSLTIVDNYIFAVNAGSNTLSMLSISHTDPTCLTPLGEPIAILGEFPNTVAASRKSKLVCVGTTGAKAGVSCASFSEKGLTPMDALRPFDINQQTPPLGPLNTVSQVFFSTDESQLFTTVKGDPTVNNTGFLSTFRVSTDTQGKASVSTKDIRSSPNGTAVLFGSVPIPGTHKMLFVTDASFGAAIIKVDSQGHAQTSSLQAIAGQQASCWATISHKTRSAYVTDVGRDRVVEMSIKDASIIKELDLTAANGDPGLTDSKSAGDFIYILAPGNGTSGAAITVLDVSGGQGSMKQVQHFELGAMAKSTAMGMAVLL